MHVSSAHATSASLGRHFRPSEQGDVQYCLSIFQCTATTIDVVQRVGLPTRLILHTHGAQNIREKKIEAVAIPRCEAGERCSISTCWAENDDGVALGYSTYVYPACLVG